MKNLIFLRLIVGFLSNAVRNWIRDTDKYYRQ